MEHRNQWTIEKLGAEVAEPGRFAGGGAVAAMSLVGAAATAELVISLSQRRRNLNEDQVKRLDELARMARAFRDEFLAAIDADIDSLNVLMEAQRTLRRARKSEDESAIESATSRMAQAVQGAIDTPLAIARDAVRLLDAIAEAQPSARWFTMSDLGAAAATTRGAIDSLLLMAEVNLGMVDDPDEVSRLRQEILDLSTVTHTTADRVIAATRETIHQDMDAG